MTGAMTGAAGTMASAIVTCPAPNAPNRTATTISDVRGMPFPWLRRTG